MTCWQPPTFTFSALSCLNGDIYNEVILTGHPILLFITFLSVNEQSLCFFSCHPMKSLTPALLCLSGEETPASVILSVVTTHQVQNGTWPGFPLLLPPLQFFLFGVFFFFWNHFNVFSAGHLSSLLLYEGLIFLIMTDEKREGVPDVMTRWKP